MALWSAFSRAWRTGSKERSMPSSRSLAEAVNVLRSCPCLQSCASSFTSANVLTITTSEDWCAKEGKNGGHHSLRRARRKGCDALHVVTGSGKLLHHGRKKPAHRTLVCDYVRVSGFSGGLSAARERRENVRLGSALISMYDAGIDDLSTGVLFFFYRQTDEGIFVPLRDPAAPWRNAWLEHILNADAETKRLLLTDMLRNICVDQLPAPRGRDKTGSHTLNRRAIFSRPRRDGGGCRFSDSTLSGRYRTRPVNRPRRKARPWLSLIRSAPRTVYPHAVSADSRPEEERGCP